MRYSRTRYVDLAVWGDGADNPADILDGTMRIGVGEARRRARALASLVIDAGLDPAAESPVVVSLPRSADLVVAYLAIAMAGGVVTPIDPDLPDQQRRHIAAQIRPRLAIASGSVAPVFGTGCRFLPPDAWAAASAAQIAAAAPVLDRPAPTEQALYMSFTSGTTGVPKGVLCTAENLEHLMRWTVAQYDFGPGARLSATVSPGFDVSIWEHFVALATGASIHLADDDLRANAVALRKAWTRHGVTHSFVAPQLAEELLALDWSDEPTALRSLFVGGDRLRRRPPAGLPFALFNLYGPTECTVIATGGVVAPVDEGNRLAYPDIGRPLPGLHVLVVDDGLRPVPAGTSGQLCIAGPQVSRGYANDERLTAERFRTFAGPDGVVRRYYCTGDLVSENSDGTLCFHGRNDGQIKIDGVRLELGQIETALATHPRVERAVALAVTHPRTGLAQVGCTVIANGPVTAADLTSWAAARLPRSAVPSSVILRKRVPLTTNGNADVRAMRAEHESALNALVDRRGTAGARGVPPETSARTAARAFGGQQKPSGMRYEKYASVRESFVPPGNPRAWPDREITAAPLWVPVDLRDGNQSLPQPMTPERKLKLFRLLVALGYKEIEVGYPAASELDFAFVRMLAESSAVPDDVTVVVFTPARDDAIDRTVDSLNGLPNAMVHLCVPTAPMWRELVLGRSRGELLGLIGDAAERVRKRSADRYRFQFSPEAFTSTEIDFALEACDLITERWDATPERPVVLNLPATVETAGAHRYADQIEYVSRSLARRDGVVLSIHPHNDRGSGVAAAELGILAGAERVEGCLFGNGERTGNVDLVTLALNVFSQGIDPMVDFSDLDRARNVVEECTGIAVHSRHPYAGDLVFTAFSGTHQDAIRKGVDARRAAGGELAPWRVPYVPVDPTDLGRSPDLLIRVTSQSGKSGMAYLLRSISGLQPPVELQREFSAAVQAVAEQEGELSAEFLTKAFKERYFLDDAHHRIEDWTTGPNGSATATVQWDDAQLSTAISTADPVGAATSLLLRATGADVSVLESLCQREGVTDNRVACFVKVLAGDRTAWGAAVAADEAEATFAAVLAACRSARTPRPATTGSL